MARPLLPAALALLVVVPDCCSASRPSSSRRLALLPAGALDSWIDESNSACRRCTHASLPSQIVYGPPAAPCGISDHFDVAARLARLAVSLCARLVPERPLCETLLEKHNRGRPIDCKTQLAHYINLTRRDGGGQMLAQRTQRIAADVVRIWSSRSPRSEYEQALNATRHGLAFHWQFRHAVPARFDDWERRNPGVFRHLGPMNAGPRQAGLSDTVGRRVCDSVATAPSADVIEASQSLMARVGLKERTYATVHIRRQDAAAWGGFDGGFLYDCNTSVPAVASFVACSLGPLLDPGSTPTLPAADQDNPHPAGVRPKRGEVLWTPEKREEAMPIVFFTDATDKTYLQELHAALVTIGNATRRVVHGDAAIEAQVKRDLHAAGVPDDEHPYDNFFTYAVGMHVQSLAKRSLQVHFSSGSACTRCGGLKAKHRAWLTFSEEDDDETEVLFASPAPLDSSGTPVASATSVKKKSR